MNDTQMIDQEAKPVERLTASQIRADVNLIQEVMKAVMTENVHYGKIIGCGDKPTLLKPGAEKIASTFRLAIDPIVEDLSSSDEIRYRIAARVTHQLTGQFLGSGIGEASTNEQKYKWRKIVCEDEWNATPEDRKRIKYGKDYTEKQIRTNPADVANTVLKMAKKRALVDAVLTITAASDCFTQDIEDLPEELAQEVGNQSKESTIRTPKAKAPDSPTGRDKSKMRLMDSKRDGSCNECGESTLNSKIYWDGVANKAYHEACA